MWRTDAERDGICAALPLEGGLRLHHGLSDPFNPPAAPQERLPRPQGPPHSAMMVSVVRPADNPSTSRLTVAAFEAISYIAETST